MENHLFLMGKLTISMAIFNSYVSLPEGNFLFFVVTSTFKLVTFLLG